MMKSNGESNTILGVLTTLPITEIKMADTARARSFKARHGKNIAKGKMSAAYWANKVKW